MGLAFASSVWALVGCGDDGGVLDGGPGRDGGSAPRDADTADGASPSADGSFADAGEPTDAGRPGPCEGREALLDRRVGFGRAAGTGSLEWPAVMVTNLDDSGPGSLRDAVGSEQRWVCFEEGLEGTIELGSTLRVSSNVVLDGRGAHITLRADSGTRIVTLQSVDNVIVTNFELEGGEDGVFVRNGSSDIWLDHLSSGRARDEVFAITGAGDSASDRPDRITVSFTRVVGAGKVMLLGSTTTAENNAPDRVTLHHNYWSESVERHPLVRFARVHAFNNWIHHWGSEGTGQGVRVGADAQFYSEANIYEDRWGNPALVPENLGTFGFVDSVNDLVVGDPRFEERMPDRVFDPAGEYPYTAEEPGDALRARLQAEAGWQP